MKRLYPTLMLALGSLGVTASGCALGAAQCLRTPVSSKIAQTAVDACGQALETNLDRRDVFFRYVELLRVRGEYKEIEQAARKVRKFDLARSDAVYYMAYSLRKQGRHALALRYYQAFSKANPKDPDPHFGIALCHEGLGNRSEAVTAYQKYLAVETRPAQQKWRKRASARLQALGGGGALSAKAWPPKVVRAAPAPPKLTPAIKAPAKVAARVTPPVAKPVAKPAAPPKPSGDCGAHEKAIAADPFATQAYEKFATCAAAAGRHGDVARKMRIALRDNPDFARGWLHLGNAQTALKQATSAKSSFGKACAAGVATACGR